MWCLLTFLLWQLFIALGTVYLYVPLYEAPSHVLLVCSSQGGNYCYLSMCWYPRIHCWPGVTPSAACTQPDWAFMCRRKKSSYEGLRCPARLWQLLGEGLGLSSFHPPMTWWARGSCCLGLCVASWRVTFLGQVFSRFWQSPGTHPASFQSYAGGGKYPAQVSIAS